MEINDSITKTNVEKYIDCLANKWGEIVEKSPIVSPLTLYKNR